jgi:hypothetical protein
MGLSISVVASPLAAASAVFAGCSSLGLDAGAAGFPKLGVGRDV